MANPPEHDLPALIRVLLSHLTKHSADPNTAEIIANLPWLIAHYRRHNGPLRAYYEVFRTALSLLARPGLRRLTRHLAVLRRLPWLVLLALVLGNVLGGVVVYQLAALRLLNPLPGPFGAAGSVPGFPTLAPTDAATDETKQAPPPCQASAEQQVLPQALTSAALAQPASVGLITRPAPSSGRSARSQTRPVRLYLPLLLQPDLPSSASGAPVTVATSTASVTSTPTSTASVTPTSTASVTPTSTSTASVTPTSTPTSTSTASATPTSTASVTPTSTASATSVARAPDAAPLPTLVASPISAPNDTLLATATAVATATASSTATASAPSATAEPAASSTATASVPTASPTACPVERRPLDVILVIDVSHSIAESQALDEIQTAAKGFLAAIDPALDRVGLVTFNADAELVRELAFDRNGLNQAIDALHPRGGTDIAAGINRALQEFRQNPRAGALPAMILLTDGQVADDSPAAQSARAAAERVRTAGVRLITVGLGSEVNTHLLRELAWEQGHFYHAPQPERLAAIYRAIATTLACPAGG